MKEIIGRYFEKGFLLTPQALDFIMNTGEDFDIIAKDFILDVNNLIPKDRVTVIKNLKALKHEITTEDFVRFYTSKYEKMKDILVSRLQKDFISLNKIDSLRSDVYIIGIVREIRSDGDKKVMDLEDMTTSVPVIFDAAAITDVEVDDVIGVHAISGGKVLFGKEVLYPDIPLRPPAKGRGRACFVSDLMLNEAPQKDIEKFFSWFERSEIKNLFITGTLGDKNIIESYARENPARNFFLSPGEKDGTGYPQLPLEFAGKNITSLSNPSMIDINGIKILMIGSQKQGILKKRHLGRPSVVLDEDYLVMDEIPDIVHVGSSGPQITNYKSVTVVSSGSLLSDFRPVVIDFATRSAEFMKVE